MNCVCGRGILFFTLISAITTSIADDQDTATTASEKKITSKQVRKLVRAEFAKMQKSSCSWARRHPLITLTIGIVCCAYIIYKTRPYTRRFWPFFVRCGQATRAFFVTMLYGDRIEQIDRKITELQAIIDRLSADTTQNFIATRAHTTQQLGILEQRLCELIAALDTQIQNLRIAFDGHATETRDDFAECNRCLKICQECLAKFVLDFSTYRHEVGDHTQLTAQSIAALQERFISLEQTLVQTINTLLAKYFAILRAHLTGSPVVDTSSAPAAAPTGMPSTIAPRSPGLLARARAVFHL